MTPRAGPERRCSYSGLALQHLTLSRHRRGSGRHTPYGVAAWPHEVGLDQAFVLVTGYVEGWVGRTCIRVRGHTEDGGTRPPPTPHPGWVIPSQPRRGRGAHPYSITYPHPTLFVSTRDTMGHGEQVSSSA
jgi:hypothetical protein